MTYFCFTRLLAIALSIVNIHGFKILRLNDQSMLNANFQKLQPVRQLRNSYVTMKKESIDVCMGCFWKPQQIFDTTTGVIETYVGYTGKSENSSAPTYKTVCSGDGHIEAVRVFYDDGILST